MSHLNGSLTKSSSVNSHSNTFRSIRPSHGSHVSPELSASFSIRSSTATAWVQSSRSP